MTRGQKIGSILGIDIKLDWSWFFIFALVTVNLATIVFPRFHPTTGTGETWFWATVASLLFFSSVMAHELAHSVVAQATGLKVKSITLFIFGGVASIEKEPKSARDEFLIAAAGPLMSFLLGFVFLLMGGVIINTPQISEGLPFLTLGGLDTPYTTLMVWLGSINIILGIFNLVPGFPLDGGRVFRSMLWHASDNLIKSTKYAVLAGQAVAGMMMVAGVLMIFGTEIPFFGSGLVGGAWLVFIGWFLNNAASKSYEMTVAKNLLSNVQVEQLMKQNVIKVDADTPLDSFISQYVLGKNERSFLAVQENIIKGIFSVEDIRRIPESEWNSHLIRDIMIPSEELDVINHSDSVSDAISTGTYQSHGHIPVLKDGNLVGILRKSDILFWMGLNVKNLQTG